MDILRSKKPPELSESHIVPNDADRYFYKQRLAKLQVDLKQNAHFHRHEADRLVWIYFFVGFIPIVVLSGAVSVMASGWYPDALTREQKDSFIAGLGILNAMAIAVVAYWNWMGGSEKHK